MVSILLLRFITDIATIFDIICRDTMVPSTRSRGSGCRYLPIDEYAT